MRHMFPEERDPWSEIKSPRLNSLSIFIMSCGERLRGWVNLSSEFCIHLVPVSVLVFFPFCSNEMCLASNIYTRETISKWRVCPSLSVTGGAQGPGELDEGAPHPGLLSDGRHANRDNHHPHSSVRLQTHMSIFWQNIWSFLLENSFDGKRGIFYEIIVIFTHETKETNWTIITAPGVSLTIPFSVQQLKSNYNSNKQGEMWILWPDLSPSRTFNLRLRSAWWPDIVYRTSVDWIDNQ